MAADLHIHAYADGELTDDDFRAFFSNTVGSKWFNPVSAMQSTSSNFIDKHTKISNLPSVWIGEVSWLKASLFEDNETFIPDTVVQIHDLIGEDCPVLNDELIQKIMAAFKLENKTLYKLTDPTKALSWLTMNKGRRVFTISW